MFVCIITDNINISTNSTTGILSYGTSVAARQPKQKDKNEEWILAVVLSYHTEKNKYDTIVFVFAEY